MTSPSAFEPLRLTTRLWRRLTESHPAILEPAHRRRARLLSGVLIGLIGLTVVYELWYAAATQLLALVWFDQKFLLVLGGLAFLLVTYWLSRSQEYRRAATLFVVATNLLMLFFITVKPDSALDTAWLLLGLLACSLFFSPRTTALYLAVTCASILILPKFAYTPLKFDIVDTEIFLITSGLFIITVAAIRQQDQTRLEEQARTLVEREAALACHTQTMEALYAISLEINSQPDMLSLLNTLTRRVTVLLGTQISGIYLLSPTEHILELVAVHNLPEKHLGIKLEMGEGLAGQVAQSGQPLVVDDYQHWAGRSRKFKGVNFGHALSVPLKIGGRVLGVIDVTDDQRTDPFGDREIQLLSLLADQAAIAVENARLHEEARQYAQVLEQRVTERTEQLKKTNRELQEALAARQEFLSRASHALRTPLHVILGFAQVMEMAELGSRQKVNLQHILKAGRALLDLVNHLLDLTRLESGQISFSLEPVAVYEVTREAHELMGSLAAERGIQIRLADLPSEAYVRADHYRLGQVMLNLLSNAVKYNPAGSTVVMDCEARPADQWRINIRDSGPGLSAEQCAGLFSPFNRLLADQPVEAGSGLGLSLSKQLVEAMGGSIGVESVIGEGSTFWVELPRVESPVVQPIENEVTPVPAATSAVLYVEDNPANLKLLEQILVYRPEIKLIATMQGRLGLDLAREHQPDLILLDLDLPDLPGLQVLLMLQADPRTQAIPVVVISADATPHQIERLLESGARAYLTKPMDVRQFLETLDRILH
ncbi:MAG: hybrid sensor histidine kinase/response regulator [Anaerolineales bacterium]